MSRYREETTDGKKLLDQLFQLIILFFLLLVVSGFSLAALLIVYAINN